MLCLAYTLPVIASESPKRVVSLNPCLDAILVEIAPREQIAALSFRARDPAQSVLFEVAKTYPITYETAEEVVALQPDVVLATRHSALATRNALRRVGIRTVIFDVPESVEESLAQVQSVAHEIGREQAGAALIARIQTLLKEVRASTPRRPARVTTLIFQPSGLAPGSDTLIGELMQLAGFKNIADHYGIARWGLVAVEQVVAEPPQVLLMGEVSPGAPTWAERKVQHPALRFLAKTRTGTRGEPTAPMLRVTFPARLLNCGGPVIEPALRSLIAARLAFDVDARR